MTNTHSRLSHPSFRARLVWLGLAGSLLTACGGSSPETGTGGEGGGASSSSSSTSSSSSSTSSGGDPCAAITCGEHATCSAAGGPATCVCDAGYQDNDSNDTCTPACDTATCSGHGTCDDSSGDAVCTCDDHFTGAACDACEVGYEGAACDACAAEFFEYPAGSGTCVDDPCQPEACNGNGTCSNTTGAAVCTCAPGYGGADCGACDAGFYEYPAGSGTCVVDPCLPDPCNGHGTCSNTTGAAVCTCNAGYAEASCNTCVRYVDVNAAGDGSATSWANAATKVQTAIDAAKAAITGSVTACEVWVAEGTYYTYVSSVTDTINLRAGVRLQGGFAGGETARASADPAAHPTILSGRKSATDATNSRHVVSATNGADTTIDGFTVRDGNGFNGNGGGIFVVSSTVTVANCEVTANATNGLGAGIMGSVFGGAPVNLTVKDSYIHDNVATGGSYGGGVFCGYGTCTVTGTRFERNTATTGGGLTITGTTAVTVSDCTFIDNVATDGGGLAYRIPSAGAADPTFTNLTFTGNRATGGGGAFYTDNAAGYAFENALMVGNAAGSGGAIFDFSTDGVTCNGCTISGNWASSLGDGIFWGTSTPRLYNSIVWGNPDTTGATGDDLHRTNGSTTVPVTSHCDIRGYALSDATSFDQDPEFASAPRFFDWTLAAATTTTLSVTSGAMYTVGDVLEIGGDGVARTVTEVSGNTVTFSPAIAASAAGTQIRNWGAALGTLDYELLAGSMCIDAADAATAPATDIEGQARSGTADIGAYESP